MISLDLACGQRTHEGFVGVDFRPGPKVDIVHDLTVTPWPFKTNSVDAIVCEQYIEHCQDLIAFMNEAWRILKPGGTMRLVAPYYTSIYAWQDPTHVREISENSMVYYNKAWRDKEKVDHYDIKADFEFKYAFDYNDNWRDKPEEVQGYARKHFNNVVDFIIFDLVKR